MDRRIVTKAKLCELLDSPGRRYLVIGGRRLHYRVLIPQFIAYSLLVVFNFGFTVGVTKLLSNVIPAVATRTLALATTTLWNFYLYKTRIFKTDDNPVY